MEAHFRRSWLPRGTDRSVIQLGRVCHRQQDGGGALAAQTSPCLRPVTVEEIIPLKSCSSPSPEQLSRLWLPSRASHDSVASVDAVMHSWAKKELIISCFPMMPLRLHAACCWRSCRKFSASALQDGYALFDQDGIVLMNSIDVESFVAVHVVRR